LLDFLPRFSDILPAALDHSSSSRLLATVFARSLQGARSCSVIRGFGCPTPPLLVQFVDFARVLLGPGAAMDKGKRAKVEEEDVSELDAELVQAIEKLQEVQDELERVCRFSFPLQQFC